MRYPNGVALYTSASEHDVRAPYTHIYQSSSIDKTKERGPLEDTLGRGRVHEEIRPTKEPEERNGVTTTVFADLLEKQNEVLSHHIHGTVPSEEQEALHAMPPDTLRKLDEPYETYTGNQQYDEQAVGAFEEEETNDHLGLIIGDSLLLEEEKISKVGDTHDDELDATKLVLPTNVFGELQEKQCDVQGHMVEMAHAT